MSFFQRLREAFSSDEYDDYYYYDDVELGEAGALPPTDYAGDRRPDQPLLPRVNPRNGNSNSSNNVIGLPGLPGQTEVLVMEPRAFEEMTQAVNALRERKSVILNLSYMDTDHAQRSADYVSGATYAIDGNQTRLGDRIFLFTPNYVNITNHDSNLPHPGFAPSGFAPPAPMPELDPQPKTPMPPALNQKQKPAPQPVDRRQMYYDQNLSNPAI
jgi:cell division inhibitor SepF